VRRASASRFAKSLLALDTCRLALYAKDVEVEFTAGQKAFIRQAIETGRIHHEEEAVQAGLSLWEERERRRLEILSVVDKVEASLARGEGRMVASHDDVAQLVADVKRRGIARLAGEQNNP
jgi:Arc/MetJ-type ribon-helix-helix transcriptional regulator